MVSAEFRPTTAPRSTTNFFRSFCAVTLLSLLVLTACRRLPQSAESISNGGEWHEFQGTWTAVGSRDRISLGERRQASIAKLEGSLVLAGSSRPAVGFRAEALVLSDSATGTIGRAVWTDEHGDQVFSELAGQGTSTGSHISGTFVGGTGRYAGATGGYEFSWRFVLEAEDGTVQGQSDGLTGKIRVGSAPPAPGAGAAR
jgi:hypothetical protein